MELEYWSSKGNYGGNVQESVGKRGFQVNKRSMQRVWAPVLGVAMMRAVSVRAQAPEQSAPPPATQTAPAPAPAQSPVPYQPKFAGDPKRRRWDICGWCYGHRRNTKNVTTSLRNHCLRWLEPVR